MDKITHRLLHLAALCILLCAPLSWGKTTELPYFSATYDALIKGVSVTATREFKPVNDTISELNFNASSWLATLSETSQFSWEGEQIKPIQFTHERNLMGSERKKTLTFDWLNNIILSTTKGKTYTIPNPEQALDRLSFQLQLQYDLVNSRDGIAYRIADKKRIKEYRFEIIGEEKLATAVGTLDTIKVKVVRENKKRVTYLWLAKNWHHLLVNLEQHNKDEKEFELQLTSATIDGKKVTGHE